jgi:serine protease AprX
MRSFRPGVLLALVLVSALFLASPATREAAPSAAGDKMAAGEAVSTLVQAGSLADALAAVESVGARATHRLGIIDAVAAPLTAAQKSLLAGRRGLSLFADGAVSLETGGGGGGGNSNPETFYPTLVGANQLHSQGLTGFGVTVAVLDTGYWRETGLSTNAFLLPRVLVQYDATRNRIDSLLSLGVNTDENGHGSHVSSVILDSTIAGGKFRGVAPGAFLVSVKAFGEDGRGSYANVIRGLDWVVANRQLLGIKVLNLSFSAPPASFYWDDPLNQAVMKAWKAGITVVAAAGNRGPEPLSIGVPGNLPYVITVGAMTDNYTPSNRQDDRVASFSSAGPTVEGFIKPEMVAPGGHVVGLLRPGSEIFVDHPSARIVGTKYGKLSGTSQATAVVSGIVALMLEAKPNLSPNTIKCRLMLNAKPSGTGGNLGYSVLQQGAGLAWAPGAVADTRSGCANQGLDIDDDLSGERHFAGPVRQTSSGDFVAYGSDGRVYQWDGTYQTATFPWIDNYQWITTFPWIDVAEWDGNFNWVATFPWIDAATFPWIDQYAQSQGQTPTPHILRVEPDWSTFEAQVPPWVPEE